MPSLSVHLRLGEDHSSLPFHPSCPICRRDRLAGALATDELVSRRTQATIAAGLLAFSGVGAPAALAADPDSGIEGTTEVTDGVDPDSFEIGADTVQLVDEPAPADEVTAPPTDDLDPSVDEQDNASLEGEPEVDAVEPAMETEPTQDIAAPPAEAPPSSEPEAAVPEPVEVATESSAAKRADIRAETSTRVSVARERPAKPTPERSSTPVLVRTETPTPAAAPAPAQTTTHRVTGSSAPRAKTGDRIHVVRPGESLWSIASDFLGDGASVAQVAREVSRLWELNEDRIATGSPDLLYAGTRLRLR